MSEREQKGPDAGAAEQGSAAGGQGDQDRLRKLGMQRKMMLRKAAEGRVPHGGQGGGGVDAASPSFESSHSFESSASFQSSASFEMSSASAERIQAILEMPDEAVGSMESAELQSAVDLPPNMWAEMEQGHGSGASSSSSGM